MLLMTALGMALMLVSETETLIGANYRDSVEASYVADAGIERVMQDVLSIPDWNTILTSPDNVRAGVTSGFVDGTVTPTLRRRPHHQPDQRDQHDQLQQDHELFGRGHERQRRRTTVGQRTTRASASSPGGRSTISTRRPRSTRRSMSPSGLPTTAPETDDDPDLDGGRRARCG